MSNSGAELARLFLGSYRKLVDVAIAELAVRGYEDVRPVHEFTMQVIASGATTAAEIARALSVSKQAATKTIVVLLERGYIARDTDPTDPRRKRIQVTSLGFEMMREGAAIFDELRQRLERQLGERELAVLEAQLTAFVGSDSIRLQAPGWIVQDAGP